MATSIEFNNVSKQYRLGLVSTKTLSHDLNRWWQTSILHKEDPYLKIGSVNNRSAKADSEYVWALKDIDFKVEQGDVIGIIGKNGAGKSTLLKLLSRVTGPTTGSIKVKGRIGALLEVGTGFHPEMTGRENIYMNGAILGMTKQEIANKLDEIVDFSGCERYIDTPVKRYSSGMMVRLGFAVAAHLDPEILVVDEVLAVGDAEFQKKAIGKMQDVSRGEGRTVLFVSHNMASISSLCRHCLILKNGLIEYLGNTDGAIELYRRSNSHNIDTEKNLDSLQRQIKSVYVSDFYMTDGKIVKTAFSYEDKIHFNITVKSNLKASVTLRISVFDINNVRVLAFDSSDVGKIIKIEENTYTRISVMMKESLNIKPGKYSVNVSIRQGGILLDHVVGVSVIDIVESDFYGHGHYNITDMAICLKRHEWIV